jgi:hypothetical protein
MDHHIDGTLCKAGTRDVPQDFQPCCITFAGHVATCEFDIRYEWWGGDQVWVIAIADSAGGGGIVIRFCPHCSKELVPVSQVDEDDETGPQPGRRLRIN